MPCSLCGKIGHSANTCYKHINDDQEAAPEATKKDEVTTAPEATKKDEVTTPGKSSSLGGNDSEDAPPTKKPRTKEEAIRGPVQVPSDDDYEGKLTSRKLWLASVGRCVLVCLKCSMISESFHPPMSPYTSTNRWTSMPLLFLLARSLGAKAAQ